MQGHHHAQHVRSLVCLGKDRWREILDMLEVLSSSTNSGKSIGVCELPVRLGITSSVGQVLMMMLIDDDDDDEEEEEDGHHDDDDHDDDGVNAMPDWNHDRNIETSSYQAPFCHANNIASMLSPHVSRHRRPRARLAFQTPFQIPLRLGGDAVLRLVRLFFAGDRHVAYGFLTSESFGYGKLEHACANAYLHIQPYTPSDAYIVFVCYILLYGLSVSCDTAYMKVLIHT